LNFTIGNLNRLESYRGKTVLVTGHNGFTGSWLCLWLSILGAKVVGYALEPPTQPDLYSNLKLKDRMNDVCGDIKDLNQLKRVVENYQPEVIFHLAAVPIVRESYKNPCLTYETNVMGTLNLLEAVRTSSCVRAVVVVTSEKCYQNKGEYKSYCENDPLGGFDPYSSSKACVEIMTSSWQYSYFQPNNGRDPSAGIATVRPSNIIGGGDWAIDRLIPDCVRALNSDRPILLRNPTHRRPWQFVLNPLYAYLLLGTYLIEDPVRYSEPWNIGAIDEELWSVETIVQTIIRVWGKGRFEIDHNENQLYEDAYLKMDCRKAQVIIGWQPPYDLLKGLAETVAWYQYYFAQNSKKAILKFSINQISSFMELI